MVDKVKTLPIIILQMQKVQLLKNEKVLVMGRSGESAHVRSANSAHEQFMPQGVVG